jgi:hypothetical protein
MRTTADARNHFLKALKSALDIGASGNIIFHIVDEWSIRNPSWVGGGIFAVAQVSQDRSSSSSSSSSSSLPLLLFMYKLTPLRLKP